MASRLLSFYGLHNERSDKRKCTKERTKRGERGSGEWETGVGEFDMAIGQQLLGT